MDFVSMILEWLKAHVGVIFMGVAGATVTALVPSGKPLAERVISWVVGVILCAALSTPTADLLTSGGYVEVFGFIYGMGGITLAKMLIKAIEKRSKVEIESKTGVKLDDDVS
ncbi:AB1gp75 [Acinetobacter phage AB1]|uniref:AB1gp75 n=1 Tax=Acinetobacter phage AB1 TaxID=889876 RepID=E2GM13_9CAUD|nr:AB1gp75 [Acinetobacter phage AB1]ADO14446.1 AB1gp75 [Acinetobacter phage AB1]